MINVRDVRVDEEVHCDVASISTTSKRSTTFLLLLGLSSLKPSFIMYFYNFSESFCQSAYIYHSVKGDISGVGLIES